ncbi:MAG: 1-acyl-sn-glycerol-3-phosphate acyltransferase [Chitinophagaceae bacterium]|nr:1-acyl-sn-glycerol-3-phosphate acyltransferase [Chitinophagaceae bacterium]
MLYIFAKYLVRSGLFFFCKKIVFSDRKTLGRQGPLLLACNHPNSFFDALLLGAYFNRPVHFLARGDAFRNPWAAKILTALKAIPIYRLREGKEYLALNDATFERCTAILKQGGIVLIFTEGLCLNQWKLRPLKKGTARIALNVWKEEPMQQRFTILPVSFNYSSFKSFSKNVVIHFGAPISHNQILRGASEAEQILELNRQIFTELEKGMLIDENDAGSIQFLLSNTNSSQDDKSSLLYNLKQRLYQLRLQQAKKLFSKLNDNKVYPPGKFGFVFTCIEVIVLLAPATVGLVLNLPVYLPLKSFIKKKTGGTVFYHSALFTVLIITYPIYVFLVSMVLTFLLPSISFWMWILAIATTVFCARVFVDLITGLRNYVAFSKAERRLVETFLD